MPCYWRHTSTSQGVQEHYNSILSPHPSFKCIQNNHRLDLKESFFDQEQQLCVFFSYLPPVTSSNLKHVTQHHNAKRFAIMLHKVLFAEGKRGGAWWHWIICFVSIGITRGSNKRLPLAVVAAWSEAAVCSHIWQTGSLWLLRGDSRTSNDAPIWQARSLQLRNVSSTAERSPIHTGEKGDSTWV